MRQQNEQAIASQKELQQRLEAQMAEQKTLADAALAKTVKEWEGKVSQKRMIVHT